MAQRVNIVLVDDIDGSTASESISFTIDGVSYEIDLSESNAAKLRADFATWANAARRTGGRRGTAKKRSGSGSSQGDDVREWARANGYTVKARGRVSAEIMQAYEAAH